MCLGRRRDGKGKELFQGTDGGGLRREKDVLGYSLGCLVSLARTGDLKCGLR